MRDGEEPLNFAIGVHYGHVIGGVISGEHHSEYTVIGDSVNLAARLQAMCKLTGARIVISDELACKLPRHWRTPEWQTLRAATVPGRAETVDVHLLPMQVSKDTKVPSTGSRSERFTSDPCAAGRAAGHDGDQARTWSAASRA